MIELEERMKDGHAQRWTIEGPFPGRLNRILSFNGITGGGADFLKPGDQIEVCGFFPKRSPGTSPTDDAVARRFVHGQVLVMPGGRLQSWGPYGKIDNCLRRNDRAEPWLDFLNADPLALEFWCNARAFEGIASTAPPGLVDEIDGRLTNKPCG
jgi:hypothetical protein